MLKKMCAKCNKIIEYSMMYCNECKAKHDEHKKQFESMRQRHYDKQIRRAENNKLYDSFYHSREWNILREVVIARDYGLCVDCLANNKITIFNTVHHIEPIKTAWNKRLDTNNLICLCESCHQARHNKMERK